MKKPTKVAVTLRWLVIGYGLVLILVGVGAIASAAQGCMPSVFAAVGFAFGGLGVACIRLSKWLAAYPGA